LKLNEPLETKTNSFVIGFNKPEEAGIEAEIAFHLTGSHYNETKNYLAQYEGVYDHSKAPSILAMLPAENLITGEIYMTAPYNCDKHIEFLKETWNEFMTTHDFGTEALKPRFLH